MQSQISFGLSVLAVSSLNLTVAFAAVNPTTVKPHHFLSSVATSRSSMETTPQMRSMHSALAANLPHQSSESPLSKLLTAHVHTSKGASETVTVHAGDTLWKLAKTYGVTVSELESWNHLSSTMLHVGQSLIVNHPSTSSSSLSSRDATPDAAVSNAVLGVTIAQYAAHFLGVPYVWGGTSPSGFDCSGFVKYVFAHFGVSLRRTSFDQSQEGTSVSEQNLQSGDLVFFASDGSGASHVGIYVGNGQFINAADAGVRYSQLSESYWADSYVGARRVTS